MPSLLVITPYPFLSADTRYRISQYIPGLEKAGWQVAVRPFMNDVLFKIYNSPGHRVETIGRTSTRILSRLGDCMQAGKYDVIFLHKEAFMFGPPIFESLIRSQNKRIIYDMDDAFWTHPPQYPQIGHAFRDPGRIGKIIKMSKHILAGNDFLADYARRYNHHVTLFPTVLDTSRYLQREEIPNNEITIGWVGRWSSSPYLEKLYPVFEELSTRFKNVTIRFVGSGEGANPQNINLLCTPWRLETEIEDIAAFDIGIMPLPDDEYSKGKCGFKLLQYMALGIPAVASPIGVNSRIITDSVNGFHASTPSEWIEKLAILIQNPDLRKTIGNTARRTVIERYSLQNNLPILLQILEDVIHSETIRE